MVDDLTEAKLQRFLRAAAKQNRKNRIFAHKLKRSYLFYSYSTETNNLPSADFHESIFDLPITLLQIFIHMRAVIKSACLRDLRAITLSFGNQSLCLGNPTGGYILHRRLHHRFPKLPIQRCG